MTPQEFKDARNTLRFSAAGLAKEWSMGENGGRTVRRWEAGHVPVNPIAAYCITMMLKAHQGG
jgi:DNA-binding transcriptional regulator YiaG